jgi:hypothetical protein
MIEERRPGARSSYSTLKGQCHELLIRRDIRLFRCLSAKHTLPASLTSVRNFLLVSTTLVSDAFAIIACFTSVNNPVEEFLTGVNNISKAFLLSVLSMTDLSDTTPIRYRTYQISTECIIFWIYLIPNQNWGQKGPPQSPLHPVPPPPPRWQEVKYPIS